MPNEKVGLLTRIAATFGHATKDAAVKRVEEQTHRARLELEKAIDGLSKARSGKAPKNAV